MAQYLGEHTALAEALGSVPRTCGRWFTTSGLQPLLGSMSPCAHNVCVHHAHAHTHTNAQLTVKCILIGTGSWLMGHGVPHIYFCNAVRVYTYFKIEGFKKANLRE